MFIFSQFKQLTTNMREATPRGHATQFFASAQLGDGSLFTPCFIPCSPCAVQSLLISFGILHFHILHIRVQYCRMHTDRQPYPPFVSRIFVSWHLSRIGADGKTVFINGPTYEPYEWKKPSHLSVRYAPTHTRNDCRFAPSVQTENLALGMFHIASLLTY